MGEVVVQIPVRDVLSGKIFVRINGIQVFVRPSAQGICPLTIPPARDYVDKTANASEPVPELSPDSLAQSFLHSSIHDPADSVLLDTLSHSMPPAEELGLGPAEGEGVFTSILAGFVDALKARLAIEIENLAISVQHPQSGAFILSLAQIKFLPREDKLAEKILSLTGIEAFLRADQEEQEDDGMSQSSHSTITSPSPSHRRSPSDHGLSESMMFSPQEAESLYMSAYSQPAGQSTYMSAYEPPIEETPEEMDEGVESSENVRKGFRFFYFEEDLVFHVSTSQQPDPALPSQKSRPAPVLQSAIPTAHLFLDPNVNLLPSISLISTILALSPTSEIPSTTQTTDDTGGLDFSWQGGVLVHFGPESSQSIARLADWKVNKVIGQEALTISVGKVEILSPTAQPILSLTEPGKLTVQITPDLLQISVPEVRLHIDVGGVGELQPLLKAMKLAWLESLPISTPPAEPSDEEDWNEDLIIEKSAPQASKQMHLSLQRLVVTLQTPDSNIIFTLSELNAQVNPSTATTLEFSSAVISTATTPLLTIRKSGSRMPTIEFVVPYVDSRPGFLVNGAQEILDDFLVGDTSRSDDAWGMIRADAANNSDKFVKIRIPRINGQVSSAADILACKKVLARIQKTAKLFMEESVGETVKEEDDENGKIDMVVEFTIEEGQLGIALEGGEVFEVKCDGVEGTIVNGVASGGEMVGVVDVTKIQVDVSSPSSLRKVLDESIHKVVIPILNLLMFRQTIPHPQLVSALSIPRTVK